MIIWLFLTIVLVIFAVAACWFFKKKGWISKMWDSYLSAEKKIGILTATLAWLANFAGAFLMVFLSMSEAKREQIIFFVSEDFKKEIVGSDTLLFWLSVGLLLTGSLIINIKNWLANKRAKHFEDAYYALSENLGDMTIDIVPFFTRFIKFYYKRLRMEHTDRVTLFRYNRERDMFVCVGRYSENEEYKLAKEKEYPAGMGCIGFAWSQNTYEDKNLPDPSVDYENYISHQTQRLGCPEEIARNLNMRSRSYKAIKLKDEHDEAVGVIVFESTKADGVPSKRFNVTINELAKSQMAALIMSLSSQMPKHYES